MKIWKCFRIADRQGRFGLDIVLESRVTGEVFLLCFENPHPGFNPFFELKLAVRHAYWIKTLIKRNVIALEDDKVIHKGVYC